MADSIHLTGDDLVQSHPNPKSTLKRKRLTNSLSFTPDDKISQIQTLDLELHQLFTYYHQVLTQKPDNWVGSGESLNEMVALLLEESKLALSKLVEEIYGKIGMVKEGLTLGMVKSAVLFVGQRVMYGVQNVDADVLEDVTNTCLWCWETRDLKLMPKSLRAVLKIRRLCRKKICERITAVSAMINALQKPDSDGDYKSSLVKASEKLSKILREPEIRLLVDSMLQKNDADMAGKEVKKEEKLLLKQLMKSKKEAEKEKNKMNLELEKEKKQLEKEQKRLQEEAEKDERRREKEMKKQQEEAEREQRCLEKEKAELKRRASVQKQASIMERFLKRSRLNPPCQNGQLISDTTTLDSSIRKCENMPEAVTLSMDSVLSSDGIIDGDIWMLHLASWRCLGHSIRSNKNQHWSTRKKPKTELFKELKLTINREQACDVDYGIEKHVSRWGEQTSDDTSCHTDINRTPGILKCFQRKQLLQFDKSPRPAFYGIWPKKSHVVGPRHPFRKEPDLDYDVDSDEEWEEEDPGESLSDCDKDDEEGLEEACSKGDDGEESEDGFFVPDGYLSENEGVQVDRMEIDTSGEEAKSVPSNKLEFENEEFYALLQRQKCLHKLTESALKKNQPLIISNIMHEKVPLIAIEDLTGNSKVEQICLQALSICVFPGGPLIEISVDNIQGEDLDTCLTNIKGSMTPTSTVPTIHDSDMPEVVSTILSCSQSINKVVGSLQLKFPSISKAQLRNKVREMSDFVDNRWQVKKEVLDKVGISISPEKSGERMQSISKFFSKRCLPPTGKGTNVNEISPQPSRKPNSDIKEQPVCL